MKFTGKIQKFATWSSYLEKVFVYFNAAIEKMRTNQFMDKKKYGIREMAAT